MPGFVSNSAVVVGIKVIADLERYRPKLGKPLEAIFGAIFAADITNAQEGDA